MSSKESQYPSNNPPVVENLCKFSQEHSLYMPQGTMKEITHGVQSLSTYNPEKAPSSPDDVVNNTMKSNFEIGIFPLCTPTSFFLQEGIPSIEEPQGEVNNGIREKNMFFKNLSKLFFSEGENPSPVEEIFLSEISPLSPNGGPDDPNRQEKNGGRQNCIKYYPLPQFGYVEDGNGDKWDLALSVTTCYTKTGAHTNFGLSACRRKK